MSDPDPKQDSPEKAPAASGTAPESGAETKEKKSRISRAAHEAWEKSFGEGTWTENINPLNWPKKSWLFVKNFFTELTEVEEEEKDVKKEAEKKVAREVLKTDSGQLSEQFVEAATKESSESLLPEEKEAMEIMTEDLLEAAKATGEPESVVVVADRIKQNAEQNNQSPERVTDSEMRLCFVTGLFTLIRLKERFDDDEGKLADFLDRVKSAGAKSVKIKDLSLYVRNHFTKLLNFKLTDIPDLLGMDKTDFLTSLNPLPSASEKMDKGLDIVLPEIFPSTVRDKGLAPTRKIFKDIVERKNNITTRDIAKIIAMLDDDDLRELAKRIGGNKVKTVTLASVKETEERKQKAKAEAEKKAAEKKQADEKKDEAGKKPAPAEAKPDQKAKAA
jgi:hypothetical protein